MRSFKRYQGLLLLTLCWGMGCEPDHVATRAAAQDARSPQSNAAPARSNSPPAAPDAGRQPPPVAAQASPSREALVALMLDAKIQEASPEQTEARFASVSKLDRSSMFPDQLDLRAESPIQRIVIEYVQGKKGLQFAHVRVALWANSPEELRSLYRATDAQLSQALGRPRWTKKVADSLPSRAYRVGKKLNLVIEEGLEKGKGFVRLELGEPQGEAG